MRNIWDTSPSWKSDVGATGKEKQYIQKLEASSYEVNWAMALDTLKIGYVFQYSISGGFRLRGGQVLDFLVLTKPMYTPLEVNGDYFHRDAKEEFENEVEINRIFKGTCFPLITAWREDSETYEAALKRARREFA
jgi:hypothetical protein